MPLSWSFKDRLTASTLKQVARERLSQPIKFRSTYSPSYEVNSSPGGTILSPARKLPSLRGYVAIPLETIPAARKIDIGNGKFDIIVGSGEACIYKRDKDNPLNPDRLIIQRDFDSGQSFIATVYNLSDEPIVANAPPIREFEGEEPPPEPPPEEASCFIDCDDPLCFVTQDMFGDLFITFKSDLPCDVSGSGVSTSGGSESSVISEPSTSEGSEDRPSEPEPPSISSAGSDSVPSESEPSGPSGTISGPSEPSEPSGSPPSEPSEPSGPSASGPESESSSASPTSEPSVSESGSPPDQPSVSSSSGEGGGESISSSSGDGGGSGTSSGTGTGGGSGTGSGTGGVCILGLGGHVWSDIPTCDPESMTGLLGVDENGCLCLVDLNDIACLPCVSVSASVGSGSPDSDSGSSRSAVGSGGMPSS